MTKVEMLQKNKGKIWSYLQYIFVFLLFFVVQFKFVNDTWFGTDELDVMLGGKTIASGYQLYSDFSSQHMPFSYYISALFDILGAKTVTMQRIAFYLFYALLWTIIYGRYKKIVGKKVLFFYPLCFLCLICCYDMGTTILSEHLAGIGFIILLLEYLHFYKNRILKVDNYIAISISIILTFGTIFVAIFGVFAIAMGVLAREIQWTLTEKKSFLLFLKEMLRKYLPLAFWVALPWVILGAYYFIVNNVRIAFFSAYTLNRAIYPKYNGYGESILKTMLGSVDYFIGLVKGFFTLSDITFITVVYAIVILLLIAAIVEIARKKEYILCVVLSVFLLFLGTRGYFNFHGTQWVEVAAFVITYYLCEVLVVNGKAFEQKRLYYRLTVVGMIFIIASAYLGTFSMLADRSLKEGENGTSLIVGQITDKNEGIWQLTFSNDVLMMADRPSIQNVGATPWGWEGHGARVLAMYEQSSPRVVLYDEEHECWGNKLKDYAQDLVAFMQERYTRYGDTIIYIRNDYYEEACKILNE